MKTKIALFEVSDFVSISKQYSGLGLGYIKSYCKIHNPEFEIEIFKSNILEDVIVYSPKIIGISSVSYFYENAVILTKILKSRIPGVIVIIGGLHITARPEDYDNIFDCGIIGEGEKPFSEILNLYQDGTLSKIKLEKINGVIVNSKKKATLGLCNEISNIDNIPHIDREDYVDKYYSYILSSRGCFFNCAFCGNRAFFDGNKVRLHSASYLYEEVRALFDMGKTKITICDEMFVIDRNRLIEFGQLLKKHDVLGKISFTCFLKHEHISNDMCQILNRLNVKEIWIEIDSKSTEGINREILNRKSLKLLSFYKIKINCIATINNTNETSEDIAKLKDTIENNLNLFRKIELKANPAFPGTVNYSIYKKKIDLIDWIFINRNLNLLFTDGLYVNKKSLLENEKPIANLISFVSSINKKRNNVFLGKLAFILNNKNKFEYIFKKIQNILYYKLHFFKRPAFPRELTIRLTNDCNLKCDFCLNKEYRSNDNVQNFSYVDLHKIIYYLMNNKMVVYLSGGEPLLNKDIFKIIKLLRLNNLYTYIFTNGYFLDKYYSKLKMSTLDNISISMDHFIGKIHDKIRGKQGLFSKVLSNLELIKLDKYRNIEINIACVINRDNYRCLSDVYDYFANLGFISKVIFQKTVFLTKKMRREVDSFTKFKLDYSEGEIIRTQGYFELKEIDEIKNQLKIINKRSRLYQTKTEGTMLERSFLTNYFSGKLISNNSRCRGAFEHLHILGRQICLWCGFEIASLDDKYNLEKALKANKVIKFQGHISKVKIPHCQRCTKIDIKF